MDFNSDEDDKEIFTPRFSKALEEEKKDYKGLIPDLEMAIADDLY